MKRVEPGLESRIMQPPFSRIELRENQLPIALLDKGERKKKGKKYINSHGDVGLQRKNNRDEQ